MQTALPLPTLPHRAAGGLVVGYSGGLDSGVLLHALAQAPDLRAQGLRAVHVHHGLQPAADAWAAHCLATCRSLDIPCRVIHVHVPRDSGVGLEAAARDARHAAFATALEPDDVLVLAHHRDDQAETVLMRALRASGPDGLAAMRPWRRFADGWLWRPLLELPRTTLEAYARAQGVQWVQDPSNAVDDADRNFLRHHLLPLLRTRWPHADASLATMASLQADAADLLQQGDADALAMARTSDPAVLDALRLRHLPAPRRARVLRHWVDTLGLPPLPARAVTWYEADLADGRDDRQPVCDWSGHRLQRWRDRLHAGPVRIPLPTDFRAAWSGASSLPLPDGGHLWIDGVVKGMNWIVRARQGGERIRLPGRAHSHSLKHVLQSMAVPPWIRAHLPLLCDADDRLLAAGHIAIDAGFDTWLREGNRRLHWSPPGSMHTAFDAPIA